MNATAIILAAGKGTRMRSHTAKPLHHLAHRPMISWVMQAGRDAGITDITIVSSPEHDDLHQAVSGQAEIVLQTEQKGTGHAVLTAQQTLQNIPADSPVLILFADTPLITAQTLTQLRDRLSASQQGADICVLGFETDTPTGYGRLKLDAASQLTAIIEEADASEAERQITLVNGGIMGAKASVLLSLLPQLNAANAQGEIYLTDIVAAGHQAGYHVSHLICKGDELTGVNDRNQLANAEAMMQQRLRAAMMASGVTMTNPETVTLSFDTEIGTDTVIEPHVIFGPGVRIGQQCSIKGFSHLEGCNIADNCAIGPFARLRAGTELGEQVKIGNFVETKNARLETGAKASHLSYIGDSLIGESVNIGAGTITCNYDGINKHQTVIEAGCFIGSNSALVAPVTIGAGSIVGAGSVITRDVAADSLALGRARQTQLAGGVSRTAKAPDQDKV